MVKAEQINLELTYSKRNVASVLYNEINIDWFTSVVYELEQYVSKHYDYESKNQRIESIKDTGQIATFLITDILKCNGKITPIQAIASSLANHLDLDIYPAIKTAMEIITVCSDSKLYVLMSHDYPENKTGTLAIKPKILPTTETLKIIEKFKYLPPNLVKPYWSNNRTGGMLTKPDHILLGKNKHDYYQELKSINILQSIKFTLDKNMLELEEESNKPLDTPDKLTQFELLKSTSKEVYDEYQDKEFYFIWKYDKRGRMYSQGYHINLQSTDYKKSLLNFAKKQIITTE